MDALDREFNEMCEGLHARFGDAPIVGDHSAQRLADDVSPFRTYAPKPESSAEQEERLRIFRLSMMQAQAYAQNLGKPAPPSAWGRIFLPKGWIPL